MTADPLVRVFVLPNQKKIICPGVEFKGLQATIIPRRGQRGNLAYEKFSFCPYMENSPQNTETHLSELVDLVLDNNRSKDLKVVDIFTHKGELTDQGISAHSHSKAAKRGECLDKLVSTFHLQIFV